MYSYFIGFDEHMLTKPTCDLSAGWAMRAALGAALFVKPNLLLLGIVAVTTTGQKAKFFDFLDENRWIFIVLSSFEWLFLKIRKRL